MTPARIVLLVLGVVLATSARAQDEEPSVNLGGGLPFSGAPTMQEIAVQQRACEARNPPRKASGAISEGAYRRLERIVDMLAKGKNAEAEPKLIEMAQGNSDGYEKALVLQTLGFLYATTKREMQAINTFEQAVATNALPQQVHEGMMFNIAQLYVAEGKMDAGMRALNGYLAESCNPQAGAHVLLANVHTEKKQYPEALKQINLALVKTKQPKESWLQLKLALHYEMKEYARCAEVLVHLIGMTPMKQEYWKQLSGILFEIKRDPEALATLALAERRGFIDDDNEIRNLSNMYMYMQIPLKAAQVLDRGIATKQVEASEKNLEALGNAWLFAREYDKAESAMARAAQVSNKGELYKRLGQIQIENENWKAAMESLQKAQQKGGLKDPGEAAFLTGVCAIQLKQWKTAEAALRSAMQHDKTAKIAAEWLNHLQEEYAYSQQGQAEDPAEIQNN